jgi:aspartyl-tRNA(Asn)/glutamyl-tRNA(Gln) amidotransferase subunit B
LPAEKLAALIELVDTGTLNFGIASTKVFTALLNEPEKQPLQIATGLNLIQESDSNAVEQWVDEVMAAMPDKIKQYKSGKKGLLGLFAGEVKKRSKGKADMQIVNAILEKKLNN